MRNKSRRTARIAAVTILSLMILLVGLNAAATRETLVSWQLSNARVLNPGVTSSLKEGTLTQGLVYQLAAVAVGNETPIKLGLCRLAVTIFSPTIALPGQQLGHWYVQGHWEIVDPNASQKEKSARHSPAVIKGSLQADLDFNPLARPGAVIGFVSIPGAPTGKSLWLRAKGSFSGNEKFEGLIQADAEVWPEKGVPK